MQECHCYGKQNMIRFFGLTPATDPAPKINKSSSCQCFGCRQLMFDLITFHDTKHFKKILLEIRLEMWD